MKGGPQTWNEFKKEPVVITRICISLDGTCIAAVFADKTLFIYDTAGEVILPPFEVDECPRSMIFSWDGKLVALGGRGLRLWNVETGKMVKSFDIKVCTLALSPDGTCIAAGCEGIAGGVTYVGKKQVLDGSYNIRVINMASVNIPDHHDPGPQLTDRRSGKRIMRLKGEIFSSPFEGHKDNVKSVAYSADGKQIASCSNDQTVRVWDVSTGSRRTFKSHSNEIYFVAFSPDGTQIVSNTGLFNLSTGSLTRHTIKKEVSIFGFKKKSLPTVKNTTSLFDKKVFSSAFSADGRFLASGSDTGCQIWDIKSHDTIELTGHMDDVTSVAFFPDGKMMSASMDGSIRVWDVELLEVREEMDGWRTNRGEGWHWILGPEKELIFWTPLPFRHARNTLVIGECMEIDFTNFIHGDEWWKCREPLNTRPTAEAIGDSDQVFPYN